VLLLFRGRRIERDQDRRRYKRFSLSLGRWLMPQSLTRRRVSTMARQKVFTALVISQIASLVDQGISSEDIAQQVGCRPGSLRVRCSQLGISLRRRKPVEDLPLGSDEILYPQPSKPHIRRQKSDGDLIFDPHPALAVSLSPVAIDGLRQQAALMGISVTALATTLPRVIAQDEAVLDASKDQT
jgi:hypothetical protein